jgi:hypothetical protein
VVGDDVRDCVDEVFAVFQRVDVNKGVGKVGMTCDHFDTGAWVESGDAGVLVD